MTSKFFFLSLPIWTNVFVNRRTMVQFCINKNGSTSNQKLNLKDDIFVLKIAEIHPYTVVIVPSFIVRCENNVDLKFFLLLDSENFIFQLQIFWSVVGEYHLKSNMRNNLSRTHETFSFCNWKTALEGSIDKGSEVVQRRLVRSYVLRHS